MKCKRALVGDDNDKDEEMPGKEPEEEVLGEVDNSEDEAVGDDDMGSAEADVEGDEEGEEGEEGRGDEAEEEEEEEEVRK